MHEQMSQPEWREGLPAGQSWLSFADSLLARTAFLARIRVGRPASPLAGVRVTDDDVLRLVAELTAVTEDEPGTPDSSARFADALLKASDAAFADAMIPDRPIGAIAAMAALSDTEAAVLALAVAVELDPRRQRLVSFLNDDVTQTRLTPYSLTLVLEVDDAARALGPGSGLRRSCLVESVGDRPWGSRPLRPADSVMWWLNGDESLDPELPAELEQLDVDGRGMHRLGVVAGPDRIRRLQAITQAMSARGFLICSVAANPTQLDALVRRASLSGEAIVMETNDELPAAIRARIERAFHLAWAIASPHDLPITTLPRRGWAQLVPAAPLATRVELEAVFGDDIPLGAALTAAQLDAVAIARAGQGGSTMHVVRRIAAGHIEQLAARITPARSWDDLVLDPYRLKLVKSVAERARHRDVVYGEWGFSPLPSTGVTAMFSGPSGTGKTLAAEIVAGALGLDLYRIDLSQLVSKYIGETEKNLSQVFSSAEASPVVLFFDEADALLGKRSEVSSSHDRYANIEVAYLLQRLERYSGVVVLATNLANNIDPAFLRRVHVAVEFRMPEAAERLRIWQRSIPDAAPTQGLNLPLLANKFELSGGSITTAVAPGAFVAAAAGAPLTMPALAIGVKRELQKAALLVRREDFSRWADGMAALE